MLNENLKRVREEKGITQSDVANAAKTTAKTVMNWESGKTEPKASELVSVAKRLNVSVNELLGETETEQNRLLEKIRNAIDSFTEIELTSLAIMIEGLYIRHQSNEARNNFTLK